MAAQVRKLWEIVQSKRQLLLQVLCLESNTQDWTPTMATGRPIRRNSNFGVLVRFKMSLLSGILNLGMVLTYHPQKVPLRLPGSVWTVWFLVHDVNQSLKMVRCSCLSYQSYPGDPSSESPSPTKPWALNDKFNSCIPSQFSMLFHSTHGSAVLSKCHVSSSIGMSQPHPCQNEKIWVSKNDQQWDGVLLKQGPESDIYGHGGLSMLTRHTFAKNHHPQAVRKTNQRTKEPIDET